MLPGNKINKKIGAAITVYNERDYLKKCLNSGKDQWSFAVVIDNGNDGTTEMLEKEFPEVIKIKGNKEIWWTAGTNLAIKRCIEEGCDYILLVNSDLIMDKYCINELIKIANSYTKSIVASVVLNINEPDQIWWAGGKWSPLLPIVPIYLYRPLLRAGGNIRELPEYAYESSDAHGRAVLFPSEIFENIGFFNEKDLPHYGADSDFTLRARKKGYKIFIAPNAKSYLYIYRNWYNTAACNSLSKYRILLNLLRDKGGRVGFQSFWHFVKRNVPFYAIIPTYIFGIFYRTYRILCK